MSAAVDAGSASAEVELILRDEIGLDASTVGSSLIQRAVHRRMEKRGVAAIESYAKLLTDDEQELQELIEQVVVPETYFFREPDAIADITRRALQGFAVSSDAPLRVLSAPCSSGEEPYSIALSLLEGGLPPAAIAVDAIDVSFEAVRRAQQGVYRSGSFRGDMSRWTKYFAESAQGWQIAASVRALVQFARGNLLSRAWHPAREQYDVIFCRNLLIYFDESAQTRALDRIASLLAPDGVLVVGSADSFAARRAGFAPAAGFERSFLFRLQSSSPDACASPAIMRRPRARATPPRPVARAWVSPVAARPVPMARQMQPVPMVTGVRTAASAVVEVARLANEGQLAGAIEAGERAIREGVVSAELLSLIGTMHAARLHLDRAETCYRKALFLEPTNEDALLHLALLLEKRGECTLANKLRSRARRALSFQTHVRS